MENLIGIEDYYSLKILKEVGVSPDGNLLAYVVTTHQKKEDLKPEEFSLEEWHNIWLYSRLTKQTKQLTNGKMNINPSFSPDGKRLAFISSRGNDDKPQICLLNIDGGEAQQQTKLKQGVSSIPNWSPDGKKIAFSALKLEKPPEANKSYRITRDLYRLDGVGKNIEDFLQEIFVIDLESRELQQVTDDAAQNINPQWSPDGTKVLYESSFNPESELASRITNLKIIEGNSTSFLKKNWGDMIASRWIDNETVVFVGNPKNELVGRNSNVYTVSTSGENLTNWTSSFDLGVGNIIYGDIPLLLELFPRIFVTPDKNSIYVQVQEKGAMGIYKIAINNTPDCQKIISGERVVFPRFVDDKIVVFFASDMNNPPDLFIADINGENEDKITTLNQEFLSKKELPTFINLQFQGIDGAEVEGWLAIPPKGQKPYPTLLNIHGGPYFGYGNIFSFDNQFLCAQGYAVLFINHRGSSGYGDAFSTKIIGDWGNLDYQDLMSGVDYAIDQGYSDPERLGVFGLSGGGNLTCWTLGNTDRFKAAIPENPITNFFSMFGVSDIGPFFVTDYVGGKPYEIPEVYRRCSPITYAHKCTTPTLMIQHDDDLRCPPEQTEQFYTILKAVGCTVEMLRFPNSSHFGSFLGRLKVREEQNRAQLEWFKKYISTT
ncbi:MAG: S9 family peptidase [Candidatus Hodarchaeales archaeon]|jgi:dipeptidyl aminopeptidase/acylaminoacyl peptidase